jgi:hypothetical protein
MVGKPNVKYVANMHGNEAVGREMMLHLILHLVQNYETDYYVRWLLDNTRCLSYTILHICVRFSHKRVKICFRKFVKINRPTGSTHCTASNSKNRQREQCR